MNFVPLKADHAFSLTDMISAHMTTEITPEVAEDLERMGGMTALDDDGSVLGMAGIFPQWNNSGLAWAWMNRSWRKHARQITRKVRKELWTSPLKRIEWGVRLDYEPGHRWARRLGFELETPCARKWGLDGDDYAIYVRIKGD